MKNSVPSIFEALLAKKTAGKPARVEKKQYLDPDALSLPPAMQRRLAPILPSNLILMPAIQKPYVSGEERWLDVTRAREKLNEFSGITAKGKEELLKVFTSPPFLGQDILTESFTFCTDHAHGGGRANSCYINLEKASSYEPRINRDRDAIGIKIPFPEKELGLYVGLHEIGHTILDAAKKAGQSFTQLQEEIFADKLALTMMKEFPESFKALKPHHIAELRAFTSFYALPVYDKGFLDGENGKGRFRHAGSLALDGKFIQAPEAYDIRKMTSLIGGLQLKVADNLLKTELGKAYLADKAIKHEGDKIFGEEMYNNIMKSDHRSGMLRYAIRNDPQRLSKALQEVAKTTTPGDSMQKEFVQQVVKGIAVFHKSAQNQPAPHEDDSLKKASSTVVAPRPENRV